MADKPTIALRANSKEQKERWETAVEESDEYGSVTHLIKKSVERELSGAYDKDAGGNTAASDDRVGEVLDTVEALETRLDGLETTVERATEAMHSAGSSVSEDTIQEVWAAIPTAPGAATTAEGIAEGTDVDADTARVALEQLAKTTAAVKRIELEDLGPVEEGGTHTIEHQGQQIPLENTRRGMKRRNPLFYKEA